MTTFERGFTQYDRVIPLYCDIDNIRYFHYAYIYPYIMSTGRYTSAKSSPRRLEAPKLHNPIAIRLNLLLDSMEN